MIFSRQKTQHGIALIVSLLFLLVVTVISLAAASNSSLSLKVTSNMQDLYGSLQAAEAGTIAALALAETANDPFFGKSRTNPFTSSNPLQNLNDPNSVSVQISLTAAARPCPRPPREAGGSSVGSFDCDYYRVDSEHNQSMRARTQVSLGVVKTILGSGT